MNALARRVYWRGVHPLLRRAAGISSTRAHARLVRSHGRDARVLVETGTYRGDLTAAAMSAYRRVFTIELDPILATNARERFRRHPHVRVIDGDSEQELVRLAREIHEPAVFWLDAHFCDNNTARGQHETALKAELEAIRARPYADVVLIDDARHTGHQPGLVARTVRRVLRRRFFPERPGYPTIPQIREALGGRISSFEVRGDVIRIRRLPETPVSLTSRVSQQGS